MAEKRWLTEDKLALIVGLFLFCLALLNFAGLNTLGWVVKINTWTDASKIFTPTSGYKLGGFTALLYTYVFITVILALGIKALGGKAWEFIKSFTVVFVLGYGFFALGSHALIAATPDQRAAYGLSWSVGLTLEAGFILSLVGGIIVGNFLPAFAARLKEALRPEMYVKIAIIILGIELGVKALAAPNLSTAVIFRGLCAIAEAYLIYWAVIYFIARKYFKFSREWAAPLASGISICGVSAAIATGGAIRARPMVPIVVSSLVVIFTCVEMLILPFVAEWALWKQPMVAGAWMGLAVKSDGGAVASGAITDALILAKAFAADGVKWTPGWITMAATNVKVFIDVFIGIWAFVLAWVWCAKIECKPGQRMRFGEVWDRFPRFVLGYVLTFLVMLFICSHSADLLNTGKALILGTTQLRLIFFALTFFTIGVVSNFRKLWEAGIGKLILVYVVGLFGFIIWVALIISWIFFHGVHPPLA